MLLSAGIPSRSKYDFPRIHSVMVGPAGSPKPYEGEEPPLPGPPVFPRGEQPPPCSAVDGISTLFLQIESKYEYTRQSKKYSTRGISDERQRQKRKDRSSRGHVELGELATVNAGPNQMRQLLRNLNQYFQRQEHRSKPGGRSFPRGFFIRYKRQVQTRAEGLIYAS